MSDTSCHNCGADPARGMAGITSYDDEGNPVEWRLCHEGPSPTCYEKWSGAMAPSVNSHLHSLISMDILIRQMSENTAHNIGGILRCETCGRTTEPEGRYFHTGWPECCGYTMRWWTQHQIDEGEMPALGQS